ncbi:phage integrase SAM-like domain-containing protein [Hymenobacter profundi]|uniref:Phage integrase SAM-like domain-containing protein n=1 Tax=Hymenobacter profundi TaxID=1982110 RepID=A0ABS6WY75_9BACT|nr:phage integrase SAM-like domain-containing protein [Hymenobacter profundi]
MRYPLTFAGMNHEFYAKFQRYVFTTRGHSINTLSAHVKRLKAFLHWSERQDIPVNRRYQDFEAPERYRGVDALTENELLRLAAVDLSTPQVRAYVAEHFEQAERELPGGRPIVTLDEHHQRLQHVRDKVLLCCSAATWACAWATPTAWTPSTWPAKWSAFTPTRPACSASSPTSTTCSDL